MAKLVCFPLSIAHEDEAKKRCGHLKLTKDDRKSIAKLIPVNGRRVVISDFVDMAERYCKVKSGTGDVEDFVARQRAAVLAMDKV